MAVTHMVLLTFKFTTNDAEKKDVSSASNVALTYNLPTYSRLSQLISKMLGLQSACLHATTQKPYILSITGGSDNSPEGLQVRTSEALEFQSQVPRLY
jgi:hypothetical protein